MLQTILYIGNSLNNIFYHLKMDTIFSGVGKRKNATARIFLMPGTGVIKINNKSIENYFKSLPNYHGRIIAPLNYLKQRNYFNINMNLFGGGLHAQIDAIRLALSKALLNSNQLFHKKLSKKSLLTSDYRRKERRKYGLKKARKASQFSKR